MPLWVWACITADAVVVVASAVMSAVAASRIPKKARVPIHLGMRGFDNYRSRNTALLMWPGSVALVSLLTILLPLVDTRNQAEVATAIGSGGALLLFVVQRAAFRRAKVT